MINREAFFDTVRNNPFPGALNQGQVDGMSAVLAVWDTYRRDGDLRWLAYMFATTAHETSFTMLPIEEYGKGSGMAYGEPDPETKQCYYGRGFVQLTWRDNYARADREFHAQFPAIVTNLEWEAAQALRPLTAAGVMFLGMEQGWFRTHKDGEPETLLRYFDEDTDDAYGAREIINGDKSKVPSWSGGVNIGTLIEGYYEAFLMALHYAWEDKAPNHAPPQPAPIPEEPDEEPDIDLLQKVWDAIKKVLASHVSKKS